MIIEKHKVITRRGEIHIAVMSTNINPTNYTLIDDFLFNIFSEIRILILNQNIE